MNSSKYVNSLLKLIETNLDRKRICGQILKHKLLPCINHRNCFNCPFNNARIFGSSSHINYSAINSLHKELAQNE